MEGVLIIFFCKAAGFFPFLGCCCLSFPSSFLTVEEEEGEEKEVEGGFYKIRGGSPHLLFLLPLLLHLRTAQTFQTKLHSLRLLLLIIVDDC